MAHRAPGGRHPGASARLAVRYVSRRQSRQGMVHGTALAGSPSLWNRPRPVGSGAHDDALPLPRARMPQAVLRAHRQFGHYRI